MPDFTQLAQLNTPQLKIPNLKDLMAPKMSPQPDPAIKAGEITVEAMEKVQNLMTGVATFNALRVAADQIAQAAPADDDVVIEAFGIVVTNVSFAQPHMLLLGGRDKDGNTTIVVAHYSQIVARVVYQPKQGPERIITGFGVASET
jgi:hypothetical protein